MGLLFVLIFGLLCLCILAFVSGFLGLFAGFIYSDISKKNIRYWAWFVAPAVLLFAFAGLFFFENVAYGIVTNTDIGIGDYECANINSKYRIGRIDGTSWYIEAKNPTGQQPTSIETEGIQELLVQNDTIAYTTRMHSGDSTCYTLVEVLPDKGEFVALDTVTTTKELWDNYAQRRNIDNAEILTPDDFYWESRKKFILAAIIINIILLALIIRKWGRFVLLKKEGH